MKKADHGFLSALGRESGEQAEEILLATLGRDVILGQHCVSNVADGLASVIIFQMNEPNGFRP